MKRESFRSRLGFLLVSAGCAIGIGNVWDISTSESSKTCMRKIDSFLL